MYSWFRTAQLIVHTPYQRKLVWTLEEKRKLIESVNKNFPIPAIILAELPGETPVYEIIDGLQRLNAILTFIEGTFPSGDGLYFNIDSFPTALELQKTGTFPKLESDTPTHSTANSAKMLDYNMSIAIMRNASDEEINDVFGRINTYGHRLSNQERRQAGLTNDFTDTVRHLAASLRIPG